LKETFRRLEKEMEGNSTLRKRVQSTRRRLEEAEAALDPVTHFEELSGHAFETDAKESSTTVDPAASTGKETQGTGSSFGAFVDELLRVPTALRWAGAAAALLLGAYGTLFVVSQSSQSTLDRLAVVDVSNQVVDNYTSTTTRSATPSPDTGTAGQLYVEALTAVQSARTSTLGLFPSYDADSLDRAEQLLQKVLDRSDRRSFLALEAHFYLGKVGLAQRQVDEARSHFKTVVKREGRMAEEAQDILETLHEEYVTGGPNAG
jgi:TolA-binding protein